MPSTATFLRTLDARTCVRLQPSPISGVGVFALHDLREGADPFIGTQADIPTRFVPDTEMATLSPSTRRMVEDFCLPRTEGGVEGRWVYREGFAGMDTSFYLNHAEMPQANIVMVDDPCSSLCVFRAARRIAAGEELLFDYHAPPVAPNTSTIN